jgi:hypothetical protein
MRNTLPLVQSSWKSYNNTIEYCSIVDGQTNGNQIKATERSSNKVNSDLTDNPVSLDYSTNYAYTKEDIDNFYASDNG